MPANRNLPLLISSEFLSAFADNAVLFALVSLVQQSSELSGWYIPALQAAFLVAFIPLAPWVGRWADRFHKNRVLIAGNCFKLVGIILLLLQTEPLLAYAIIGVGAAIYSPAKFGILPEISNSGLVAANGWVESTTILAILGGGFTGALVADYDLTTAFLMIGALYLISAAAALPIKVPTGRSISAQPLKEFITDIRHLLTTPATTFSIAGTSLFWGSAVTLRLTIVAWAPVVLALHSATEIAQLTLFSAIGIATGSLLAPKIVKLGQLDRARNAAMLMGIGILLLSLSETLWSARLLLFLIGVGGGVFIIPINALVQHHGYQSIGAGKSVAVQRFMENLTMLSASGLFALYSAAGYQAASALAALGVVVLTLVWVIGKRLPAND